MRFFWSLIWLAGLFGPVNTTGQTTADLERRLQEASTPAEKGRLNYQLAEYHLINQPGKAALYAKQAAQLAVQSGDKRQEALAAFLGAEADMRNQQPAAAAAGYEQVLKAALQDSLPEITLRALEQLQTIARQQGNFAKAFEWSQAAIRYYKDQIGRDYVLQRAKNAEMEADLQAGKVYNKRVIPGLLFAFGAVLLLVFYNSHRAKRRIAGELAEKNAMIEEKRRRSEHLLLNILPQAVAMELSFQNQVKARRYEKATVMFVDFAKFTQVAESLSPEELVAELHQCFSAFDNLIGKLRVEKIKTAGDAYICASGLSDRNERPHDMIGVALKIQDFLQKRREERLKKGLPCFEARIGIHFGPVVAGVVGVKKFAYDIWGDTVNIAARLEESCEPNRINISRETYDAAEGAFDCSFRGKIASKNKAEIEMYYVNG